MAEGYYTLLISFIGGTVDEFQALSTACQKLVHIHNCKIALSSHSNNPLQFAQLYEQADITFKKCNKFNLFLHFSTDELSYNNLMLYPHNNLQALTDNLENMDYQSAQNSIANIFDILEQKELPVFIFKSVISEALTCIITAMHKHGIALESYYNIYISVHKYCIDGDKKENIVKIKEGLLNLIGFFSVEINYNQFNIVAIYHHIEKNYQSSDLTVNSIADTFNLNISYLSHTFKKRTGVSISHYIWEMRYKKACELLQKKDINIQTISEMVGYDNCYSFSRKFKDYNGQTPSQYRKGFED